MNITELKLCKNVTGTDLINAGFKRISENIYYLKKPVYKSTIFMKIEIDLENRIIDYDAIDMNTQTTYSHFWNNINGSNNIVALTAIHNFKEYIFFLERIKILKVINNDGKKEH